ncbi:MAG: DUF2878 domain-containing protein [Bryobacteraceae bacterium]
MRNALNILGFQLVWFACVLSAAAGQSWIGLCVFAAVIGLHLLYSSPRVKEAGLLILAACLGLVVETVLLAAGAFRFPSESLLPPAWMIALWVNFATTLRYSMRWLEGRYALAAVLGAVAGPLAYLGGARLGAIAGVDSVWPILVAWAAMTPFLVWIAKGVQKGNR